MKDFEILRQEIDSGLRGLNSGLPMGFHRLNRYIGIRKRIYSLIFGATGSGKSSFAHSAYILNPYDWYISKEGKASGIKFRVFLFSMERNKVYTLAKWVSRKIFLDHGIVIQVPKMLGWWEQKMSSDEHDLFCMYEDYLDEMMEHVTIIEGSQNPTAFYKMIKGYAEANGETESISEYKKVYHPNHPNEIVVVVADHMGLIRPEKGMTTKKEAIDKVSEYFQHFRDFYGYTPVAVSQINRDLSNPLYLKQESFEPNLDQVKESGRPAEDSENIISLFDPLHYRTTDSSYDASKFVDKETGGKYFRSIRILKNTYGEADVKIGLAFMGSVGIFAELPRRQDMEGFDYSSVLSGSYFLNK